PGVLLDGHLVAGLDEQLDADGHHRDAILVRLDLLGHSDAHSSTSPFDRRHRARDHVRAGPTIVRAVAMGSDNRMNSPSAICIVSEPHPPFKNHAPSLAGITRVGRCIMSATFVLPECTASESVLR